MVKPKKHLGQHFLNSPETAERITQGLTGFGGYKNLLEIGPGTGALTGLLLKLPYNLFLIDVDSESIDYLENNFTIPKEHLIQGDFLTLDIKSMISPPFGLIGNFPYNISSQIMFRVLEMKEDIPEIVGMFQKEVAERLVSPPGSKKYGILSVLLQTWYDGEYLFTVEKEVFIPPPKVRSGVIRFRRNKRKKLEVDGKKFKQVIKMAFNQRRKTLRNSLKAMLSDKDIDTSLPIFSERPEQLSVEGFIELVKIIFPKG